MSDISFNGFAPQTFEFFEGLLANNNRPWFEEHKPAYQKHVLEPLKAFAAALSPAMHQIDAEMDFRPQKMISRIYRDVRFSHDKSPYKRHMWISFQRPFERMSVAWETFPGYYMEIGAEGVNYGMGMWAMKKKIMDRFRAQVEYEQDHFREMTEPLIGKHHFEMGGEPYKRPMKNDLPPYFQPFVQRRSLHLYRHHPIDKTLYSANFVSYMEKEFALLAPLYHFLADLAE